MAEVVRAIDEATAGREVIVCAGVGSHQQIVAREFSWDYPRRRLLTSSGHGTMGTALPYAIGAQLERPDALVIVVTGDGSFQMELTSLATVAEYRLPIKVVVADN